MAKKSRKPNLPQSTLERARRELYGTEAPEPQTETPAAEAKPVPTPRKAPRQVNLSEEYAYVVKDLQNMGMLATAMMVVLVVMSLFI